MRYDGSNELHAAQARARLDKLIAEKKVFDLTEKKNQRSLSQNAYLHVILAYFACQYGETLEYVKMEYFKRLVNPGTFIRERDDRFRNWPSSKAGVYLPSSEEGRLISLMEMEIERNKNFI